MGSRGKPPGGTQDNRSMTLGNRSARAPVDNYRKRLGSREVHSSSSRREKKALERGHDAALDRSSASSFFTSTPFLLSVLVLLAAVVTTVFGILATTPSSQAEPQEIIPEAAEM